MRHLFTTSDLALSKAIRYSTGEPCSHYAMEFGLPDGKIYLQSDLLGARPLNEEHFFAHKGQRIVMVKEVPLPMELERAALETMLVRVAGKNYDLGALLYQGLCYERHKLFGTPIPKINAWDNRTALLCTEMYDYSPDFIIPVLPRLENTVMVTPYQLGVEMGATPLVV